jgi:hypothetical protein
MRAVPRLCINLYPGIRLTTKKKSREKRLTQQCWARFVWSTWWPFHGRPRPVCWPSPTLACASGDVGHTALRRAPQPSRSLGHHSVSRANDRNAAPLLKLYTAANAGELVTHRQLLAYSQGKHSASSLVALGHRALL